MKASSLLSIAALCLLVPVLGPGPAPAFIDGPSDDELENPAYMSRATEEDRLVPPEPGREIDFRDLPYLAYVTCGDFTNDGKVSLVAADLNGDDICVAEGKGDGTFGRPVV